MERKPLDFDLMESRDSPFWEGGASLFLLWVRERVRARFFSLHLLE